MTMSARHLAISLLVLGAIASGCTGSADQAEPPEVPAVAPAPGEAFAAAKATAQDLLDRLGAAAGVELGEPEVLVVQHRCGPTDGHLAGYDLQVRSVGLDLTDRDRSDLTAALETALAAAGYTVSDGVLLSALNGLVPITPMQGTRHEPAFVQFGPVDSGGMEYVVVGLVVGDRARLPAGMEAEPAVCG
jgi:hypothetical protein